MNIVVITPLLQQFLFSKPQSNWQGRDNSSHVKDVETGSEGAHDRLQHDNVRVLGARSPS